MIPLHQPAAFLALTLLAAIIGGYTAVLVRVPRVVGYMLAGLVMRWILATTTGGTEDEDGLTPEQAALPLEGIKALALGIILFTLGGVFELRHVKSVGLRGLKISLAEIGSVLLLVALGCGTVWLVTERDGLGTAATVGLLLGIIGIATAPAATVLVIQEYDARGPVSDSILTLTAINNMVCIVLFHTAVLVLASLGLIEASFGSGRMLWLDLLLTTVGSVALGALLGFILSVMYSQLALTEFFLVFLGLFLSLSVFDEYLSETLHLSFNYLLVSLLAGATFANITTDQQSLHDTMSVLGKPLYAAFFVLAGYDLRVEDLGLLGALGVAYVALRCAGKYVGGYLGTAWIRGPTDVRSWIGLGMMCQAGVAIGLVAFLTETWGTRTFRGFAPHPIAQRLETLVLGSVVLFELVGPLLLRGVVIRSGEVKALTLMRRTPSPAPGREAGVAIRLGWTSLVHTLRPRSANHRVPEKDLRVRHIMRSNVRTLPAAARIKDVLHFVERSRDHHFPVVDEQGLLVGVIHFSDLRDMLYEPALSFLVTAHDLARQATPCVPVDMPLSELLLEFERADVSSLPVVASASDRRLVGVVEQRDVLKVLHDRRSPIDA